MSKNICTIKKYTVHLPLSNVEKLKPFTVAEEAGIYRNVLSLKVIFFQIMQIFCGFKSQVFCCFFSLSGLLG